LQRVSVLVAAAICATTTWFAVHVVDGVDLTVGSGQRIDALAVALTAVVAAGAGWLALALVERRSARPRRTWTILAIAVFVVSLLGPLGGTTAAAKGGLLALHSVVAAVVILGLGRTVRTATTSGRPVQHPQGTGRS
jgi:hypothetical protein